MNRKSTSHLIRDFGVNCVSLYSCSFLSIGGNKGFMGVVCVGS